MDEQFRAKLDAKLAEYRAWSAGRVFPSCRVVQYVGVDLVGAKSLPLSEVESEIEGLVCEGFYLDWTEHKIVCTCECGNSAALSRNGQKSLLRCR
jgi:hypothetical protein